MSKSVTADLCSLLSWDTKFWGLKIARINRSKLTQEDGRQAINWCASNNVGCLYFSADGTCRETLSVAASNGSTYVDTRIDLQISTAAQLTRPPKASHCIREAGTADLPVLRSIARRARTDTRFFKDANITKDRAAELYKKGSNATTPNTLFSLRLVLMRQVKLLDMSPVTNKLAQK